MLLKAIKPKKSLNKAFVKVKPTRSEIEAFKDNLKELISHINKSKDEEFHKNLASNFLKQTYYDPDYFINTKERTDLVIHNGKKPESNVGVLIETKRPTNKTEMVTKENINTKAFQELVLYFLRERITLKNHDIRHLVVTNINEWFIFDANGFEKYFAQNKALVKKFTDFENGRLSGKTTAFFYNDIAKPFIDKLEYEIEFTHFNIQDYEKVLNSTDPDDDNKLIALFKIFSPQHLLKLPFANDSNSLDKKFYGELLHIIGLSEVKAGSKKLIERNKEEKRCDGSLIESAITQLHSHNKIHRLDKPEQFGETYPDQLFNVALELSIIWINRILFLKLLESQLVSYHKADSSFEFLNFATISEYDTLDTLFFQVLAQKQAKRTEKVKAVFPKVPYLNSSLFECSVLEGDTISINSLVDDNIMPIYSNTVLKDQNGKKKGGDINPLEYLFEFLNAYDFSSEGKEDIQEERKSLINASVLGLIFEKINGYKDGSFFTPGFITMYMCHESIRNAVVQKFNEVKGWSCKDLDDVDDQLEVKDRQEANDIINSLKICDPAVGSGHFLISALNELIAIKSDLRILQDRNGKRLKEYHVEVVNDELIVTDEDGDFYSYNPTNKESQRIQEALFHEKQIIIESCLFGVDINPNAVNICRLRLWIELLKNTYYRNEDELEILPNIDINIKCGNSLINRFETTVDVKQAIKNSEWTIESYQDAVDTYRNAKTKTQKRDIERLINDIKTSFKNKVSLDDPKVQLLKKKNGELTSITNQPQMFEMSKKEEAIQTKKLNVLTKEIEKLEAEVEELKSGKIYEDAFEWRFEFPEVLNKSGEFIGFDTVIGNPPYVFAREHFTESERGYFNARYDLAEYQLNLYILFLELGTNLIKSDGMLTYITPNNWLTINSAKVVREFVLQKSNIGIVNFYTKVFEDASVDTCILMYEKGDHAPALKLYESSGADGMTLVHEGNPNDILAKHDAIINIAAFRSDSTSGLLNKIELSANPLSSVADVKTGLKAYQTGKGKPAQTKKIKDGRVYHSQEVIDKSYLRYLKGKDVQRYGLDWSGNYLSYGPHLAEPRKLKLFSTPRILVRQIPSKPPYSIHACYTEDVLLNDINSMNVIDIEEPPLFLLGLLNSRLMTFWFVHKFGKLQRGVFPQFKVNELAQFPIATATDKQKTAISEKVETLMAKKKADPLADTSTIDRKIDKLVYTIYGMDDDEIQTIETKN